MSVDVKYLSSSQQDIRWGITVNTVGHQQIKPYASYPSANHPSLYLFSPDKGRILDEFQIVYIIEGGGSFTSDSTNKLKIKGGYMIMLFPGEWHTYSPDTKTGWYEHWIGFNGSSMDSLIRQGFFSKENPVFEVGVNEDIIRLYKLAAKTAIKQSSGFQQILAGIVHLLLGYTYSENKELSFANIQVTDKMNMAKHLIAENYNKTVSPRDIAAKVHMSYSRFRKVFKQYTGFSPLEYRENIRTLKAKELLANTYLTSQEIAFQLGFDTPYYFCVFFKKRTGYSPLQYRVLTRGGTP